MQKTGPLVPLKELRRVHALTHEGLAERMRLDFGHKVTGDALVHVERGSRNPSPALLAAIAAALQIHPDEIHRRNGRLVVPIRTIRKAWGLTLPALAERVADEGHSVTDTGLSNVELGHRRGSDQLMRAWANALRIHPLDIDQDPPPSARRRSEDLHDGQLAVPA